MPRTPSSCTFGFAASPMKLMLTWPKRSICVGIVMAWRRPLHRRSKISRKRQPALDARPIAVAAPTGTGSRRGHASRVGHQEVRAEGEAARPAASRGTRPRPDARTSPSSRQASGGGGDAELGECVVRGWSVMSPSSHQALGTRHWPSELIARKTAGDRCDPRRTDRFDVVLVATST